MRNCQPDIDKETRNNIMSNFMLKLKRSGYDEIERKERAGECATRLEHILSHR